MALRYSGYSGATQGLDSIAKSLMGIDQDRQRRADQSVQQLGQMAQQQFANELATSRESRAAQAEKDRLADRATKEEANRLLSTAFSNVPTTRSVESEVVEGPSAGNQAQREAILAENERLEAIRKGLDPALNQQAEEAGAKYADLFERYSNPQSLGDVANAVPLKSTFLRDSLMPTGYKAPVKGSAVETKQLDLSSMPNATLMSPELRNRFLGTEPVVDASANDILTAPLNSDISTSELQQSITTTPAERALQDSGLLDINKRIDELSTKELAKVPELRGATPAQIKKIQKTVKLKPEEQISELRNSIMNLDIPYEYKKDALTSMDSMFPRPKQADPIALAKFQFEVAKEEATAGKERNTVEAWNRQNGTNFETMDQLKLSLTTSKGKGPISDPFSDILTVLDKDTEDANAWINFLSQNKEILDGMGKADKERITNFVTARYAHESSWDPTDIFGGSAMGDVLDEISEVFPVLKYRP